MSTDFDAIVVGGGIVGLACARELALRGLGVAVLEAESTSLTHTSSRNSEVIHAGIYYPPGSLKAALCVAGKERLYRYCADKGVPHRRIGKLIVATDDEDVGKLEGYLAAANANGVCDLEWRSREDVATLEPDILCAVALWSPSTGILDTHTYAQALEADLEHADGMLICHAPVQTATRNNGAGWTLSIGADGDTVTCRYLVNAAGLHAVAVARAIDGLAARFVPQAYYAIGHYFTLAGRAPFRHLIYPTATNAGLGVHVTLDMAGQARFGPDVEWIDGIDYRFDEARKPLFIDAIRRYYPGLDADRLTPGYTGIRPKISGPGEAAADFVIQGATEHDCDGLVNLFGIESPGITASLALADRVAEALGID